MQCPECAAEVVIRIQEGAARCNGCGAIVKAPPLDGGSGVDHVASETSFARLNAERQNDGTWLVTVHVMSSHPNTVSMAGLADIAHRTQRTRHPAIARLQSVDAQATSWTWSVPSSGQHVSLSSLPGPHQSSRVRLLVEQLAYGLQALHNAGMGAANLAPDGIFIRPDLTEPILVPSPWLSLVAQLVPPEGVELPFVAPELAEVNRTTSPVQSDLYGLGCLTWFLLTGEHRARAEARLPSEVCSELTVWDAFIDGCCRSHPERRFRTIGDALAAVPPTDAHAARGSQANRSPGALRSPHSTWSRHRWKFILAALVILLLVGVILRRDQIAAKFPNAAGFMTSYQRGFGDTILRYADRTYDGAQWVKLQEADSLTEVIPADPTARTRFASVAGWDSDTFCVTANAGWRNDVFFWFDDGHWSARGEAKGNADAYRVETRFIDAETLVYFGAVRAAIVSPAGVTEYDDDFLKWRPGEISVVSDDLLFFHDSHNALLFTLVDGEFVRLKKDREKEAFVHRRDNTPLKEYGLDGIRFSRSTSDGHVTALAYINEWGGQPIVVRFENGIWYEVEELSDKSWMNFNAVWLTTATETPTLFLVGDKGLVLIHEIGGAQHKQTVTVAQETTSGDLTAVWGVSPDRYWVMDTNGTVWERSQCGWRAVVRGLYRDDVQFRDAWVSPTGTVIAITEDAVYRLE